MNENNQMPDNKLNSIEELRCKQTNLLKRVKNVAAELSASDQVSKCATFDYLLAEVVELLDTLSDLSANPGSAENYLWICDTAISWEKRLSSLSNVFKTDAHVYAPNDLSLQLSPEDALSETELEHIVARLAKVIYTNRLRKDHHVDYKKDEDWYQAEVFLTLEILDGNINFARRINSLSYPRLEKVWFSEVRELIAYLDWENDAGALADPHDVDHNLKAWEDLKNRLLDSKIKKPLSEFGETKRYLEENYVTQIGDRYLLDDEKLETAGAYNIIRLKSDRIRKVAGQWDADRYWDHDRNWKDAKTYVQKFYENIIPAVNGDVKSAEKVIEAFNFSLKSNTGFTYEGAWRIINSFEMAVAIYFISMETLENIAMLSEQPG